MFSTIRTFTIFLSLVLLGFTFYEAKYVDHAQPWKNYKKPQAAAYASLEQDQAILKELDRQTTFNTYKTLDPAFFVKPTIFDPIQ